MISGHRLGIDLQIESFSFGWHVEQWKLGSKVTIRMRGYMESASR